MLPNENVWITLMQKSIKMKEYIYLCNILILAIKYVIEREVNCFFLYISCQCEVTTVFSFWLHFHPDKENYENRNLRRLLDCYYFHLSLKKNVIFPLVNLFKFKYDCQWMHICLNNAWVKNKMKESSQLPLY